MTLIFSGIVKEKTGKYLIVENVLGVHRIPLNHLVEVNGIPEVNCENIIGKPTCVLSIDGKFWVRIMKEDKH